MDDWKQEDPVVVKQEKEENMYVSTYHVACILFSSASVSVSKSTVPVTVESVSQTTVM